MKRKPLPERSVQLTDTRILHDSSSVISQHLSLHAEGYCCHSNDLCQVLLSAAARHSTIEAVCVDLLDAPHANTIRGYLHSQLGLEQIAELEADWNRATGSTCAFVVPARVASLASCFASTACSTF